MGRIIVVGSGVEAHIVARCVDKLSEMGHRVEVVASPEKLAEVRSVSVGYEADPRMQEFIDLVNSMGRGPLVEDDFVAIRLGSNDAKKVLPRADRNVYGSKRSRAGRAARWS